MKIIGDISECLSEKVKDQQDHDESNKTLQNGSEWKFSLMLRYGRYLRSEFEAGRANHFTFMLSNTFRTVKLPT
ncbi:MAG: hypothetical protein P1U58_09925 [Verrucomicrobiales bacterium]|nr:hypothetical protein [Verrucomicrobiales bacterium]